MIKHLAILLLLLPAMVWGQSYPGAPITHDITGFKGNLVRSDTLTASPADSAKGLTAVASYRDGGVDVPTLAPTIVQRGRKYVVQWNTTPPFTDGYYRVLAGTQTIVKGAVHITTSGISLPPGTSGTVLSGIYSQLGVLQGLYAALSANTPSLASYTSFTAANAQALAGINAKITNLASVSATFSNALVLIAPRYFETLSDALSARSTAPAYAQQWIVRHDETYLINGVAQWQSYEWDGKELYYTAKSKADGSPGTPSFNTAIDNINAKFLGYIPYVQVVNYAAAVAQATGSTPKRIRVLSDSNRGGYPMTYDYYPDSVDTDKLEPASF